MHVFRSCDFRNIMYKYYEDNFELLQFMKGKLSGIFIRNIVLVF